jgi:hypothetical protein
VDDRVDTAANFLQSLQVGEVGDDDFAEPLSFDGSSFPRTISRRS